MSFIDRLRNLFRNSESSLEPAVVASDSLPATVPTPVVLPEIRVQQSGWPAWLLDEDALRDEGVIFGLSESDAAEKTEIIRSFFAQQTAGIAQTIDQQNEKIGELNLWINQKEDQIQTLELSIQQLKNQQFDAVHYLPRTLAGLLLACGMCAGNYFLIQETFSNTYTQSQWIAVGVFLAGMFNLFGRVSFLHEDGQPVRTWKKILEEIGMPLAASTFVFVVALSKQPVALAFALWFFVFFLFMFSGKLLLGNLTVLQTDWLTYNRRRQLKQDKIHKVKEWEDEIAKHKQEIELHRAEKQRILPYLTELSAEQTRLTSQRDMLVKLFESEFQLARNLKKRLTKSQISKVIGNDER